MDSEGAFMTGIFSMLGAIAQEDMSALLDGIRISTRVREALLEGKGSLYEILAFVKAYESGKWEEVRQFVKNHSLRAQEVSQTLMYAVIYAEEAFSSKK